MSLNRQQFQMLRSMSGWILDLGQFDLLFPDTFTEELNDNLSFMKHKRWLQVIKGKVVFDACLRHWLDSYLETIVNQKWDTLYASGILHGHAGEDLHEYVTRMLPENIYEDEEPAAYVVQ